MDISDKQLVSLKGGTQAYVFKLNAYDKTRDGEIYVIVTTGGTRIAYKPQENITDEAPWKGFWGINLKGDVKVSRVEVAIFGNAAGSPAGDTKSSGGASEKWRLAEITEGDASISIDAQGDPKTGYDLTGRIGLAGTSGLNDAGLLPFRGRWDPATPNAPVKFEAENVLKPGFEKSLGNIVKKDWIDVGSKVFATLTLDPAWVKRLQAGYDNRENIDWYKEEKKYRIELEFPMKLKFDPTKPAFAMTVKVDPLFRTASIALDAGQTWDKPYNILPVKFPKVNIGTDDKITRLDIDASGEMDFITKATVDLKLVTTPGKSPELKLDVKNQGDFVAGTLKLAGIPPELSKYFTALSSKIKFNGLKINASLADMTKGDMPDVAVDFSVDLPNWQHRFDLKIPDVDLGDMPKFAKRFGDLVWPVLIANAPKISIGLAFGDLSGVWPLAWIDIDFASLKIDAAGNITDGYTLTGLIKVKEVGELQVKGRWDPNLPFDPIKFEVPNIFLSSYKLSLGKILPAGAFEMGDKIIVELIPAPAWVAALKAAGVQTEEQAKRAGRDCKIDVGIPLTLKIDPTKAAMKMEMRVNLLTKKPSLRLADKQTWDKPLGILPLTFSTLEVGADKDLKAIVVRAAGGMDLFAKGSADLDLDLSADGKKQLFTVKLKPEGNFFAELIKQSGVGAAEMKTLEAVLSGLTLSEMTIDGDYADMQKGGSPDLSFSVKLDALGVKKTFNISIIKCDFSKPKWIAGQVVPQILAQLGPVDLKGTGTAILGALGLSGKITLIDRNLTFLVIKMVAEGSPNLGYTLDGFARLSGFGQMNLKGQWDAANPLAPIVFEADNIFKPPLDKTLSRAIPKDKFELKDKIYVTMGLAGPMVESLKGRPAPASSGDDKLAGFSIDVNFPVKLQIDPTKPAFDMTATVKPLEQTASIALDPGVVWDKPFNVFPVTFSSLTVGTDPTLTSLDIQGAGATDFLEGEKLEFNMDIKIVKDKDPDVKIIVLPSPNLVKAIMKKAKVPPSLEPVLPSIKLEKFNVNANLAGLIKGDVPDIQLKFTVDHALTGKVDIDVKLPAATLNDPAGFAKKAAEQIVSNLEKIATLGPKMIENAGKTVVNAAKDPVGTAKTLGTTAVNVGKDLGNSAMEFAKDPAGGAKKAAEAAANTVADLGKDAVNKVSDKVSAIVQDPVGEAVKAAEEAKKKAEAVLGAASDALSAVGDFLGDVGEEIAGWFGGGSDGPSAEQVAAKERAEQAKIELAIAEAALREAKALAWHRAALAKATTAFELDELKKAVAADKDLNITLPGEGGSIMKPKAQDLIEEIDASYADLTANEYRRKLKDGSVGRFGRPKDGKTIYVDINTKTVDGLNAFKNLVDGDDRLTADQKAAIKSEIDAKITPPKLSRDDAMAAVRKLIPTLGEDLVALKKLLYGEKVAQYVLFPNVSSLSSSDKTTLVAEVNIQLEKFKAETGKNQYDQMLKVIADAKTATDLKYWQEALSPTADKTTQVQASAKYIPADQKSELSKKIDVRLTTIKTEGPLATMKAIRAYAEEKTAKADLLEIKKFATEFGAFIERGENRDKFFGFVTDEQMSALSKDQKKTLKTELDAILGKRQDDVMKKIRAMFSADANVDNLNDLNGILTGTGSSLGASLKSAQESRDLERMKKLNDLMASPDYKAKEELRNEIGVLTREQISKLSGEIQTRINSLGKETEAAIKTELAAVPKMSRADLDYLRARMNGTGTPNLSSLSGDNKNKLSEAISKREVELTAQRQGVFDKVSDALEKAKAAADFQALLDALGGKTVAGMPDCSPLTKDDIADLTKKVKDKLAPIVDAAKKKAGEYIAGLTGNATLRSAKEHIDGKKETNHKNTFPDISLLTEADRSALKSAIDARLEALAMLGRVESAITSATTEAELGLLKDHLGGKTDARFPDVSGLSAEEIGDFKKKVDARIAKFPEMRKNEMAFFRTRLKEAKSLKQIKLLTDHLAGSVDRRSNDVPDIDHLTAAQIDTLKKEVDARVVPIGKAEYAGFFVKETGKLRADVSIVVRDGLDGQGDWSYLSLLTDDQKTGLRNAFAERDDKAVLSQFRTYYNREGATVDGLKALKDLLDGKSNNFASIDPSAAQKLPPVSSITESQKTTMKKEIDGKIQDALVRPFSKYIEERTTTVANLVALKSDLEGKTIVFAAIFPVIPTLNREAKKTVIAWTEGEISTRTKPTRDRLKKSIADATTESALNALKTEIDASTGLTPDQKVALKADVDLRLPGILIEGQNATMKKVRDEMAGIFNGYRLKELKEFLAGTKADKFFPDVSALTAEQKNTLKTEIDAWIADLPNKQKIALEQVRLLIAATTASVHVGALKDKFEKDALVSSTDKTKIYTKSLSKSDSDKLKKEMDDRKKFLKNEEDKKKKK